MKLKTKVGDFKRFGAVVKEQNVTFTFEVNTKKKVNLILINKQDLSQIKIDIDDSYRYGRVCSIVVLDLDYENYGYLIEEDGTLRMDPYALSVYGRDNWNDLSRKKHNFLCFGNIIKSGTPFKDVSPKICTNDYIIYRLHMRGFTMDHSLSSAKAGNYLGVIQRLNYLAELGVNVLEFQPLYDFDEILCTKKPYVDKKGRNRYKIEPSNKVNYWGYGEASYFAPKASYFGGISCHENMRSLVHHIHKKNMQIVMEMSFAVGTSEDLILDCLRFWAKEYHVDGFHLIGLTCPIERIARDPFLSNINIFYDNYPENVLNDYSGLDRHLFVDDTGFMYPLRRLINHKDGNIIEFTNMMRRQNEKFGFVNFAASTSSGYTLLDSFSYKEKHNLDNGEENRDGNNFNFSDNYGTEGETNSRMVWNARVKNCKTSLAAAIFSQSIPMIQSGDEVLNSQNGNNNPYCQDNKIGWVNFNNRKRTKEYREYIKSLIGFRKSHPVLSPLMPKEMSDPKHLGLPDLSYHGREPWTVWLSEDRKAVGILYAGFYGKNLKDEDVMLLFNFYLEDEKFALPSLLNNRKWHFVSNTSEDVFGENRRLLENQEEIDVPGGTLTILVGNTEK